MLPCARSRSITAFPRLGITNSRCLYRPLLINQSIRTLSTSTSTEGYQLNIDGEASKRLNLQHDLFKRIFGGKFLPDKIVQNLKLIQQNGEKQLKIADVATGTGIWLFSIKDELAKSGLNAELHGYDLFDEQFPPVDKRAGIIFDTLNILDTEKFKAIGEEYHYIHARLLTVVLTVDEWKVAIENCLQVLKPGGYIHFEEIPINDMAIEKSGVPETGGLLKKLQASMTLLKRDLDCGNNIHKIYEVNKLEDITHDKIDLRDCDDEAKRMQNVNARMGFEEFVTNAIARGPQALNRLGFESKEAALAKLDQLQLGVSTRIQAYFVLHSIIGKKP
ncbi:hypothetical protein TWF694_003189 [Orbilia ellipsospora]|uniref:Methyltransferase domain-containing protein n=1 Tax=Orbilia ellipsospora TaxID=2528407 RepID=A0AAV9X103_9PEZI